MHPLRSAKSPNRGILAALTLAALMLLALAPSAFAWHGDLVVQKVNRGGPAADKFTFTVQKKAYNASTWTNLTKADYTGAAWNGLSEPTNPFALKGAPAAAGPFTTSAPSPTQARLAALNAGGESAVMGPAVRNWISYRVVETKVAGYKTSASCVISPNWSAYAMAYGPWTATSGTDASSGNTYVDTSVRWLNSPGAFTTTCTFTNTYRPRLKVKKIWDDPISADPKVGVTVAGNAIKTTGGSPDFTKSDNQSPYVEVDGSSATVAETAVAGTSLSDYVSTLECRKVGDSTWTAYGTTSGTVAGLTPGSDYECQFTNTRKRGTLQVLKFTNPESITSGFDLRVDGEAKASNVGNGGDTGEVPLDSGSHTASETAAGGDPISGYDAKSFCVNDPTAPITAASFAGAQTTDATSQDVTVANGDRWVCAFLNTRQGTIKLVKAFELGTQPYDSPDSVTLHLNDVTTSVSGTGGATPVQNVAGGSTNTVSEEFGSQAIADLYDATEPVCVDQDQSPVSVDGSAVVVAPGADVVCTITNRRQTGRLTLRKLVVPSTDGTAFVLHAGEFTTDPLGNDQSQSFDRVPTGTYALGETAQDGFDLTSTQCIYNPVLNPVQTAVPRGVTGPPANPLDENGNVVVSDRTDITCTLTNTKHETATPPLVRNSLVPASDVSPVTASGGSTSRRAAARLSGTVGCAARTSSAAIKGVQVRQVTFYLDGSKVKTVSGTAGAAGTQTFRYTRATRSLRYGPHNLVAKVQFYATSKAAPKTYHLTFSRCEPHVVRPSFAG